MHYSNGRTAKVGDLVRGYGYNLKYEITGILTYANPAASVCNCQIAHVGPGSTTWYATSRMDHAQSSRVEASVEYGQLNAFVAINPETGAVLPPEALDDSIPEPQPGMLTVFDATTAPEAKAAVPLLQRGWSDQDHRLLNHAEHSLEDITPDKQA